MFPCLDVIASGVVEHLVRNSQVFQNSPADDGFLDDSGHVFGCDAAVENPLRINCDGRPVFALFQTARFVGTDIGMSKILLAKTGLECGPQGFASIRITTTTMMIGRSPVAADEDMVRKGRHDVRVR